MNRIRRQWDRVAGVLAVIAGGVVLFVGWVGISATAFPAEQLPFILSGGAGGLFLLGLGATLLLSADLRDEWNKLDRLEQSLERHLLRLDGDAQDGSSTTTADEQRTPGPHPGRAVNGHGPIADTAEFTAVSAVARDEG